MLDRLDEKSHSWPFVGQATPRNSQAASISRMDIGNTIFTEKSIKVKTCGKSAMSETGLPTDAELF